MSRKAHLITSSHARSLAEAIWGVGGTHSHRMNRKGAFSFDCSSHGGLIIDGDALTEDERARLAKYSNPIKATLIVRDGRPHAVHHEYKRRGTNYLYTDELVEKELFVLEEDSEAALAFFLTGVRCVGSEERDYTWAASVFARNYQQAA